MSRRKEIGVLVVLLGLLVVVLYRDLRPNVAAGPDAPTTKLFQPLRVPNPALHLDRLARIRQMNYTGSHRNIFSATPLPAPVSKQAKAEAAAAAAAAAKAGPAGPAPLRVPLTFYGMAIDPKTSRKLAFFTNGDNVYIASEGNTLLGHFRLLTIGNDTAEIEDLNTGQTATLRLPAPVRP